MTGDASVTIRRATLRDMEALVPLFDAYRQFYGQASNPELARRFLTERLERDESTVFIAEDGAMAVGLVQLYPMFSSVSAARIYVLNDLFVACEARRRGVARALLAAAVDFSKAKGAVRVSLSTGVSNESAQALYEATGWVRESGYYVYERKL